MRPRLLLSLLLLALFVTSCGKAAKITGVNPGSTDPGGSTGGSTATTASFTRIRVASTPSAVAEPTSADSVYIVWRDTWQKSTFIGLLTADGSHLDRDYHASIPAEGEVHSLRFFFKRSGVEYPIPGIFAVNGVPLTAFDGSDLYNLWSQFRATRAADGSLIIDPIRDDTALMQWSEVDVTGADTPPGEHDLPSTGDQNMVFASTFSNLHATPGIFDANTWKSLVWSKRGGMVLLRPMDGTTGAIARAGAYLKSADGSLVLLKNFQDIDQDPNNFYPFYVAQLGLDGTWANPVPDRDDRWKDIVIHATTN